MTGSYLFAGTDLKQLAGQSFSMHNVATKGNVSCTIPAFGPGWPRTGMEAYGVLAECLHPQRGSIPSFLKIFKQEIPERAKRTEFLIKFGLAKHHDWLCRGVPYGVVPGVAINGVRVVGHLSQRIVSKQGQAGEDVFRLRDRGDWTFSRADRLRFCSHVCVAVELLERLGLVHGDISSRNVMIGGKPDGTSAAMLCDFDGFYHPAVPLLPPSFEGLPCRPRGTVGFHYPAIMDALRAGDEDCFVATDRFALGALVCEMMVFDQADADSLGRSELLDEECILKRDVGRLPAAIRARWKDGFDLLEKAMKASQITALPTPGDWLAALGVKVAGRVPPPRAGFAVPPIVQVLRVQGNSGARSVGTVRLTSAAGDLAKVDSALKEVSFKRNAGALTLRIGWSTPIFLKREGDTFEVGTGPREVEMQPGDVVVSNFWEFRATAANP